MGRALFPTMLCERLGMRSAGLSWLLVLGRRVPPQAQCPLVQWDVSGPQSYPKGRAGILQATHPEKGCSALSTGVMGALHIRGAGGLRPSYHPLAFLPCQLSSDPQAWAAFHPVCFSAEVALWTHGSPHKGQGAHAFRTQRSPAHLGQGLENPPLPAVTSVGGPKEE